MKHILIVIFLMILMIACNNSKTDNSSNKALINDSLPKKGLDTQPNNLSSLDSSQYSFQQFWKKFRKAVIDNDTNIIIKCTKFPIKTRGPQDSDPIVKYAKKDFVRLFREYLKQDSGMGIENEAQFDVIKNLELINKKEDKYYAVNGNWIRIGDLEFNKIDNEWKLTFAYIGYPIIEYLNKK